MPELCCDIGASISVRCCRQVNRSKDMKTEKAAEFPEWGFVLSRSVFADDIYRKP